MPCKSEDRSCFYAEINRFCQSTGPTKMKGMIQPSQILEDQYPEAQFLIWRDSTRLEWITFTERELEKCIPVDQVRADSTSKRIVLASFNEEEAVMSVVDDFDSQRTKIATKHADYKILSRSVSYGKNIIYRSEYNNYIRSVNRRVYVSLLAHWSPVECEWKFIIFPWNVLKQRRSSVVLCTSGRSSGIGSVFFLFSESNNTREDEKDRRVFRWHEEEEMNAGMRRSKF
jgi:hypothetical protein